jgi:hypothetical protein
VADRGPASARGAGQPTADPVGEVLRALRERSRRCVAELSRLAGQIEELQREIDAHTTMRRPRVQPSHGVRADRAAR